MELPDSKIIQNAKTLWIHTEKYSYGTFCWNELGDLFVNSDWGFHGYSWRHFGQNGFEAFLRQINADYIVDKFEINVHLFAKKGLNKAWKKGLTGLINEFLTVLREKHKTEQQGQSKCCANCLHYNGQNDECTLADAAVNTYWKEANTSESAYAPNDCAMFKSTQNQATHEHTT